MACTDAGIDLEEPDHGPGSAELPEPDPAAPGGEEVQPPAKPQAAPGESPRLADVPGADELDQAMDSWFEGHPGQRLYLQIDKPLYQPGEAIWIRSWDLQARNLQGHPHARGLTYELISPKGAVVVSKQVRQQAGKAHNNFVVPAGVQGGEYTLRATSHAGHQAERPVIVRRYEPPRIKKKLEFLKKAYGPGDEVRATLEVRRPTGEPMADEMLDARVRLDGADLPRIQFRTDARGNALVRFSLPDVIAKGDGLLTVLVEDGGVTESISKRLPIVLKKLRLSFFPEGGSLVEGLPTRLYFEARNMLDKPADVAGRVVDDHGQTVARFESHDKGLGRFDFTPAPGRRYHAEITRPVGIHAQHPLPVAEEDGCVLRSIDDLDGQLPELRVSVRCSERREVVVAAVLRNNPLDVAAVDVVPGRAASVYLEPRDAALVSAQGVARVTLFDADLNPLAERLVYRNRRNSLQINVSPDKSSYAPRDPVTLTIETTEPGGKPVAAELSLAVVDDTVLSFADDKTGHMLSRLYLEPELPGAVEEPNTYFDLAEEKSALAMDLLMGTRGWRRFDWVPVLNPPTYVATNRSVQRGPLEALDEALAAAEAWAEQVQGEPRRRARREQKMRPAPPRAVVAEARPQEKQALLEVAVAAEDLAPEPEARADRNELAPRRELQVDGLVAGPVDAPAFGGDVDQAQPWAQPAAGAAKKDQAGRAEGWAPVRVFPAPDYSSVQDLPRSDFRETVHWAPSITTGADGRAEVRFFLSDAVTSFRATTEGIGAGAAGRDETVITSKLPFSMSVKIPLEVSAGDRIELPLTLSNEGSETLPVSLSASFGELLRLEGPVSLPGPGLEADSRASLFYPLDVTGGAGRSEVHFSASAGGLTDEFVREVTVVPLGFPQSRSASGTLTRRATRSFDLGAAEAGTAEARITLYPSPVATLVSGLDGMLREPHGCFEQTSSSNYPNVMVLKYMRATEEADPAVVGRASNLIDRGYQRLVGFETESKGFEWFGHAPAHEALTAYGLLEFNDMKDVHGGVSEAMIARTAAWLADRRDGRGGFRRDAKALDSFGRAAPGVTDAYITYSLAKAGMVGGFQLELARSAELASTTDDPYLLALATGTLLQVPEQRSAGLASARRLARMQSEDGHWPGADHSITRSTGINLHIETTALAVLALLDSGEHADPARRGVGWLSDQRGGYGQWGATQATVLALEAMTEYALANRRTRSSGTVAVIVNGDEVDRISYDEGRKDPIVFEGLGKHLGAGANSIELVHDGAEELPYSMAVDFRSVQPATDPEVVVELTTELEARRVRMGESVRMQVVLQNRTAEGQPMTLARVGLPGGLTFQTWQLKELVDQGRIAFYETRAREVVLYLRDLAPNAVIELPLDLVATVPGSYTAPASSAYLYYGNDKKFWTAGTEIIIER
jgi:hypothetical protein